MEARKGRASAPVTPSASPAAPSHSENEQLMVSGIDLPSDITDLAPTAAQACNEEPVETAPAQPEANLDEATTPGPRVSSREQAYEGSTGLKRPAADEDELHVEDANSRAAASASPGTASARKARRTMQEPPRPPGAAPGTRACLVPTPKHPLSLSLYSVCVCARARAACVPLCTLDRGCRSTDRYLCERPEITCRGCMSQAASMTSFYALANPCACLPTVLSWHHTRRSLREC